MKSYWKRKATKKATENKEKLQKKEREKLWKREERALLTGACRCVRGGWRTWRTTRPRAARLRRTRAIRPKTCARFASARCGRPTTIFWRAAGASSRSTSRWAVWKAINGAMLWFLLSPMAFFFFENRLISILLVVVMDYYECLIVLLSARILILVPPKKKVFGRMVESSRTKRRLSNVSNRLESSR